MRAFLLYAVIVLVVVGCESDVKTHQLFYGTTPPPVISITIGDVEAVKSIGKGGLPSPSMISPNQLAIVKMVDVLKGQGVGERIGLAYEAGRSNEPVAKQKYVFLWDQTGKCIQYFTVKGNVYVKDGHEIPLDELKKQ
jgi:hypothetical protein